MSPRLIVPDCPGPVAKPRAPRLVAPVGACDCHFHVFGPYDRFPPAAQRGYTPPEATVSAYRSVMRTLGLDRCVIVQPSIYGTDNAAMLEAAKSLEAPASCRMVAVIDESINKATLAAFHERGVRGIRFNLVAGGGPVLTSLRTIARRVAEFGWHIQIYASGEMLEQAASELARLPVDVVIDHFGSPDPARDLAQPGFQSLLRLLETGRAWVKLSGGYIASQHDRIWDDMAPFARGLAQIRPDRLVWGTNWPHPVRYRAMPDDGDVLDALWAWLPDEQTVRQVLVDNSEKLYGFPAKP